MNWRCCISMTSFMGGRALKKAALCAGYCSWWARGIGSSLGRRLSISWLTISAFVAFGRLCIFI